MKERGCNCKFFDSKYINLKNNLENGYCAPPLVDVTKDAEV